MKKITTDSLRIKNINNNIMGLSESQKLILIAWIIF